MTNITRVDGRLFNQIRPISIETNFMPYAEGSCLIKFGNTHVICTASIEDSVPGWMKGQGKGWISAEYNMLPRATDTRNQRERQKVGGRTIEIQRLIGRALRAAIDMSKLGERSITIDCDVIRADGGTRTASITGGYVALHLAVLKLMSVGRLTVNPLVDSVAAVSCGILSSNPIADLCYLEDSKAEVDMNFVVTGNGNFIEVQGTAERGVFSWNQLEQMKEIALKACSELKELQLKAISM